MTDHYAVMGNPIAHSLSPTIHKLFAKQTQQDLQYDAILVPTNGFALNVQQFFQRGGKGLNITIPFKQEAMQIADRLTERAEKAQAVNTLWYREGMLWGDTTDGVGLLRDLMQNHGINISGCNLLILGAGGAVRGVLEPLLSQRPQQIILANRTHEKALQLAQEFQSVGKISACEFSALSNHRFDVVINATATGLSNEKLPLPDNILASAACCYDMVYGKATPFLQWAKQQGASQIVDGLGMLVEQAAEAFFIWRGVRPETVSVIASLKAR